jgi:uncharacterized membrane protein
MYGVGAILVLVVTNPFIQNPFLVYILSLITATTLEYFTGWLMESLFQNRWWDYSSHKFNLRGRICLLNSLLFGILGVVVTYYLHPLVARLMGYVTGENQRVLASVLIMVFFIDLFYTLNSLLKFSERLGMLKSYLSEIEWYNKEYEWLDRNDLTGSISRLKAICQNDAGNEDLTNILVRLENMLAKKEWGFRLIKSFPNMKPQGLDSLLENLHGIWEQGKDQLEERKETLLQRIWSVTKRWSRWTVIKAKETTVSFAKGLSFYKLFWVFVSASILGYAVETAFCFITTGAIESRQGMIYGPFCQVYGFGAVLMVLTLMPLSKKSDRWLFLGSALVGGAVEYFISLIQELMFGSVSWDYSADAYAIGGRTSLTYMFFWGVLGLWFIKGVYPKLSALIERMPNRQGLFFSWILIITLSANMFLSGSAVYRWSERLASSLSSNGFEEFLDKQYPDETLTEIYPNMQFLKKGGVLD